MFSFLRRSVLELTFRHETHRQTDGQTDRNRHQFTMPHTMGRRHNRQINDCALLKIATEQLLLLLLLLSQRVVQLWHWRIQQLKLRATPKPFPTLPPSLPVLCLASLPLLYTPPISFPIPPFPYHSPFPSSLPSFFLSPPFHFASYGSENTPGDNRFSNHTHILAWCVL